MRAAWIDAHTDGLGADRINQRQVEPECARRRRCLECRQHAKPDHEVPGGPLLQRLQRERIVTRYREPRTRQCQDSGRKPCRGKRRQQCPQGATQPPPWRKRRRQERRLQCVWPGERHRPRDVPEHVDVRGRERQGRFGWRVPSRGDPPNDGDGGEQQIVGDDGDAGKRRDHASDGRVACLRGDQKHCRGPEPRQPFERMPGRGRRGGGADEQRRREDEGRDRGKCRERARRAAKLRDLAADEDVP
jgi:hypothetical protein